MKRDEKGRFIKGYHYNLSTEFKKGQHWRTKKPFWNKQWLESEYVGKKRTASEIAKQFQIRNTAIIYWLHKHKISTRSTEETRRIKYWGLKGEQNGMFGKRGAEVPSWKGGITAERQAFYSSLEWKDVLQKVWARDKGFCQRCKKKYRKSDKKLNKQGRTGFHIHHIVDFSIRELRLELNNLVLLCWGCHRWVHSRKNVEKLWIK